MDSGPEATREDIASLLAAKDAENTALRNENAILLARLTELEGLVAALQAQIGRDSSHSGRPPSSDSLLVKKAALKRSMRTRSGTPRGKQPGASSATLRLVDDPEDTITHTPAGVRRVRGGPGRCGGFRCVPPSGVRRPAASASTVGH